MLAERYITVTSAIMNYRYSLYSEIIVLAWKISITEYGESMRWGILDEGYGSDEAFRPRRWHDFWLTWLIKLIGFVVKGFVFEIMPISMPI